MIASIVALAMASQAVIGPPETGSPLTVSEWRQLDERHRKISIIGGVEAMLLAVSAPFGDQADVDHQCLASLSIDKLEKALLEAGNIAEKPFVTALKDTAGCSRY